MIFVPLKSIAFHVLIFLPIICRAEVGHEFEKFVISCEDLHNLSSDIEKFEAESERLAYLIFHTEIPKLKTIPLEAWKKIGDHLSLVKNTNPHSCPGWSKLRAAYLNGVFHCISRQIEKVKNPKDTLSPGQWEVIALSASFAKDMDDEFTLLGGTKSALAILNSVPPNLPQAEYVKKRSAELKNFAANQLNYHIKTQRAHYRSLFRNLLPGVSETECIKFLKSKGVAHAESLFVIPQ